MPAEARGSVYPTRSGYGIRWPENGTRKHQAGFQTKTEARRWFAENVAGRLRTGAPTAEITFDEFADLYLERHAANVTPATVRSVQTRLVSARETFGAWTLRELEGASSDIAGWRAKLPAGARYRKTKTLKQVLAAAVRWKYMSGNPVTDRLDEPRAEELRPFTRAELDTLTIELGPIYGPMVVFAAETGLRTNEWVALERRDLDRAGRAVTVQRRVSDGVMTPFPKTERSRRRVPLTGRALAALDLLPPRLDTPLLFPGTSPGRHIMLDYWREHDWYPALEAGGIDRRGPYHLRHTFATEALAAGVSIFDLSRVMGTSVQEIDKTYGHLATDSEELIRERLNARSDRCGVDLVSSEEAD